MAVGEDVPDVEEFDRADLELSPRMHWELARMAAERGEEHDLSRSSGDSTRC